MSQLFWYEYQLIDLDNIFIKESTVYILTYKLIFWVGKRELPEAPQLMHVSYFQPDIFSHP